MDARFGAAEACSLGGPGIASNMKSTPSPPIWVAVAAWAAIVVCLAVLIAIQANGSLVGQVTEVSRYAEIYQGAKNDPAIAHFPQAIPADASLAKFFFVPRFLQGGAIFQLRLKLPPERIRNLHAQYSTAAIYRFFGGNKSEHLDSPDGVPTTYFYTGDAHDYSFPPSFEILVLTATPLGEPDSPWNHGINSGVAVDDSESEIVYWAEEW